MFKSYTLKYIYILLLTGLMGVTTLYAQDFNHKFKLSNATPYVKEAVILTLDLNQTNHNVVLFFHFTLKKSPHYTFHRLSAKERGENIAAKVHYEYLIYPLHKGKVPLQFELIQKSTTEENLAYSFSGDRDNVKGLTTVNTSITLTPLTLHVKPLPKGTMLVGDFNLTQTFTKHHATAYEPLPFQVTLQGLGYSPLLENLYPNQDNFTLFKERPIVKAVNSLEGTRSTVTYPMALSHTKSFTLPPLNIHAFNPKTKQSYTLKVEKQHFTVETVAVKSLVDKIDYPTPLKSDWSWLSSFLSYLVVFIAGYFSAISLKWRGKSVATPQHPLKEKIKACKEKKQLLQLLMATDSKAYSQSIEKLESSLYENSKITLNTVKAELLKGLE